MKQVTGLIMLFLLIACDQPSQKQDKKEIVSNTQEHLTMATLWMQHAAEKQALVYQTYRLAKLQLNRKLKTVNSEKPPAIVTDVDETILDNSPYEAMLIKENKSYSPESWKEWVQKTQAKPLAGAAEFFKYAKKQGVEVFYITNRNDDLKPATIINLQKHNFPYADQAHVYTKSKTSDKTARRDLVRENYNILLFLGDNLRDFHEMFAQSNENIGHELVEKHREKFGNKFIVFPNPMYGEWPKGIYKRKPATMTDFMKRRKALKSYTN